jgi:hypothetical protein
MAQIDPHDHCRDFRLMLPQMHPSSSSALLMLAQIVAELPSMVGWSLVTELGAASCCTQRVGS